MGHKGPGLARRRLQVSPAQRPGGGSSAQSSLGPCPEATSPFSGSLCPCPLSMSLSPLRVPVPLSQVSSPSWLKSSLSGCVSPTSLTVSTLMCSPAENHLSLLYHLTAVSSPATGSPAFWVSGWLGPQQYLSYSSLRREAEPCGAWVWETQVSWYWEMETTDLKNKESLFLEALKALGGKGPYTLQGILGCELSPDNSSVPTALFALNGEDFMEFHPENGSWTGDWPEALSISKQWEKKAEVVSKEKTFLLSSCPQRLLDHLERSRRNLEWKEPPSMRLKARPGDAGFSVLTCSAFSFYPPELQLRFLHNGLAAGTGEGGFGPNGDGSFHAWSSLTVQRGDEHNYRCLVQHAGLPQPLSVELESPAGSSVPIVGIVLGFLLLIATAAGGVLLWRRMRSGLPAPWISLRGDDVGSLLPGPLQEPDSPDARGTA